MAIFPYLINCTWRVCCCPSHASITRTAECRAARAVSACCSQSSLQALALRNNIPAGPHHVPATKSLLFDRPHGGHAALMRGGRSCAHRVLAGPRRCPQHETLPSLPDRTSNQQYHRFCCACQMRERDMQVVARTGQTPASVRLPPSNFEAYFGPPLYPRLCLLGTIFLHWAEKDRPEDFVGVLFPGGGECWAMHQDPHLPFDNPTIGCSRHDAGASICATDSQDHKSNIRKCSQMFMLRAKRARHTSQQSR